MESVARTIQIGQICTVLASADVAKSGLFGEQPDPRLPSMLYVETAILEAIYAADSTWEDLQAVADYLFALCGRYTARAINIIDGGSGGQTGGVTPTQQYPIYITSANFDSATTYPNTNINGNSVIIFLNEINRYLIPNVEFTVNAIGITINVDGFDATVNSYNLVIEKYSS